jgi:ATP-dependent DNA ligase
MLARPVHNIDQIEKFTSKYSSQVLVEKKYDGERIQINYERGLNPGSKV